MIGWAVLLVLATLGGDGWPRMASLIYQEPRLAWLELKYLGCPTPHGLSPPKGYPRLVKFLKRFPAIKRAIAIAHNLFKDATCVTFADILLPKKVAKSRFKG